MNKKIIEVFSLDELPKAKKGMKYFACIGGNKNYQCFLEAKSLSRAEFMDKYAQYIDKCHTPIYEDSDIIIRQDAQYAIPGFYVVATRKKYKNIAEIDSELYSKCLRFIDRISGILNNKYGVNNIYIYYDEHLEKPSSTHFWIMPIYEKEIKRNKYKPSIIYHDIWKYQDLFFYKKTKKRIIKINNEIRNLLKEGEHFEI